MNKKPFVTVLMSVYNGSRWLNEAIESIVLQEFRDFEFLIINDGSEDDSSQIIKEWANQDSRIQYIDKANTGLTDSLNFGLKLIDTPWVARFDADDICLPDRLSKQIALIKKGPDDIVLVGCGITLLDQAGCLGKSYTYPNQSGSLKRRLIQYRPFFAHSSVMFRTDVVKRLGGYRSRLKRAQDRDLWLRLIDEGKLASVREPLVYIRKHAEQISSGKSGQLQKIDSYICMVSYWLRTWGYQDPLSEHYSDKDHLVYRRLVTDLMHKNKLLSSDKFLNDVMDTIQSKSVSWYKYIWIVHAMMARLIKRLTQLVQLLSHKRTIFKITREVAHQLTLNHKT